MRVLRPSARNPALRPAVWAVAKAITVVKMRIDLDFGAGLAVPSVSRRRNGRFDLELTRGEETVALQLSRASLERLWLVLSLRLASLRGGDQPPLPGSQN
jgi:hypothetical protein